MNPRFLKPLNKTMTTLFWLLCTSHNQAASDGASISSTRLATSSFASPKHDKRVLVQLQRPPQPEPRLLHTPLLEPHLTLPPAPAGGSTPRRAPGGPTGPGAGRPGRPGPGPAPGQAIIIAGCRTSSDGLTVMPVPVARRRAPGRGPGGALVVGRCSQTVVELLKLRRTTAFQRPAGPGQV